MNCVNIGVYNLSRTNSMTKCALDQRNLYRISNIFFYKTAFKNVFWKMSTIVFKPQYVEVYCNEYQTNTTLLFNNKWILFTMDI